MTDDEWTKETKWLEQALRGCPDGLPIDRCVVCRDIPELEVRVQLVVWSTGCWDRPGFSGER